MNVPVPGGFMVNLIVTAEDAYEARETMRQNQLLMASLDAEIAKAQAALKELRTQRSEAAKLLESNSAPSETEVREIRQVIVTKEMEMIRIEDQVAEARRNLDDMIQNRAQAVADSGLETGLLDHLDAEIEGARSVLKHLLTERDETRDDLEVHRALLSPIRRVPPEVLGEIFMHCLPSDTYITPAADQFPLLLTQISSNWRSVALATPALWTSIAVKLSTTACTPQLPLVEEWIARSGSCLLSFQIAESIRKDYYEAGMITSSSVLELYAPHYNQWQNIRLEYMDWRIDTGFASLPCAEPPKMLESLHLARDFWRPNERDQLSLMLSAPRLRDCTWISNTDLGKTFHAPFPQLSRLFLERPLISDDFMHILREGVNLEACQFFVLASSASNLPPVSSTATPEILVLRHNLRSLDITADLFGRLFTQLELPNLTEISIRRFDIVPHHVSVWPHAEFMALLARSKCELEMLSLTDMDITPGDMVDCLRYTSPTLERLVLANDRRMKHTIVDDEVLDLLTYGRGTEEICPKLSFVKFWGCQTSTDGKVADMVESRWKPRDAFMGDAQAFAGRSLNLAFFMLDGAKHPEDLRRLDELNVGRVGITVVGR
ncbi:hypothetical protein FB45DRAFT_1050144 [Roridomyces roridus]|uniref:F-box domain-containing protein n=1 Tax=Roridomyces roridus TaxID=1738132 RepID=A0AAD7CKX4_9AGAR|nr:hypothetical protein FB45DRAFT_1050144 [Roridomyces roridus]